MAAEQFDDSRCCFCPPSAQRCTTEECPCFAIQRFCTSSCETEKYRNNCLNQIVTRCSCTKIANTPKAKPDTLHCNSGRCECFQSREGCSLDCACQGACLNTNVSAYGVPKAEYPAGAGCKCNGGKKACLKEGKCGCLQMLQFCGTGFCKCSGSCNNAATLPMPLKVANFFKNPDQDGCAIVAMLSGLTDYRYRIFLHSEEKQLLPHPFETLCDVILNAVSRYYIPITHIAVYASHSPCFHQDCDPKCEVLEKCTSQRACAKRLKLLLKQVQRHLSNATITMSFKFLAPYVKRGDLYTKQSILCLLDGGIQVEPLSLKDWGELMYLNEAVFTPTSAKISMWTAANMEKHIKQAQYYINQCRRAADLPLGLWVSPFHEMVKSAILICGITQHRFDKLNDQVREISSYRMNGEDEDTKSHMERSMVQNGNEPNGDDMSARTRRSASAGKFPRRRGSEINGMVKPSASGNFGNMNQNHSQSNNSTPSLGSENAKMLEDMLLNFSSRSLSEYDRAEIQQEVLAFTEKLQRDVANFLTFLENKSKESDESCSSEVRV